MQYLTIRLFGLFDIQLNDEPVNGFRSNKARGLFAYLATEANRPIARTTLATLFWGDYPDAQARKSLRNTIANLRQIFGPLVENGTLLIDRQTIQLVADDEHCTIDVFAFDELIKTANSVMSAQSRYDLLKQAVDLYQGELLSGLPATDSADFESWRVLQQEVRHRQVMDALGVLTNYSLADDNDLALDYGSAARYARRQIELEPWQERAHQQLMQILFAQGDRSAALQQFDTLSRILDDELGVAPSPETHLLYEKIRAGNVLDEKLSIEHVPREQNVQVDLALPTKSPQPEIASLNPQEQNVSAILARLDPLPNQTLFGVDRAKSRLMEVLNGADRPWLVAIDGIGGIGKTTLATLMVHDFLEAGRSETDCSETGHFRTGRFKTLAWVSAKQEEFRPAAGLVDTGRPALDAETLTDELLEQLLERPRLTASADEKRATLLELLKEEPSLIVVDNLETVTDYQTLIPFLRQLANPAKILITTRFSLQSYSDIFCFSLTELEEADALAFLRYEAEMRNMGRLNNASDEQLQEIYHVVGGNPLALKLVIGQVSFLSLSQVLESLREARGKKIDQLYLYIYWQAWEMLDDVGRQLFLSMPVVDDGTFIELSFASALDPDDVQDALSQLMALSLVQVGGELDEPRYRLHRLTETFLMNEVLTWQTRT